MNTIYTLDVEWEVENMPDLIGPFLTEAEAREFARVNVPNGVWKIREMHYPYFRAQERR